MKPADIPAPVGILIIPVGIHDNIGAQAQTGVKSRAESARQALIALYK